MSRYSTTVIVPKTDPIESLPSRPRLLNEQDYDELLLNMSRRIMLFEKSSEFLQCEHVPSIVVCIEVYLDMDMAIFGVMLD